MSAAPAPSVIVQGITTRWTKASRGAPQAGLRAAVPEAATLPVMAGARHGVFVHGLEAREGDQFVLEELDAELHPELPVTAFAVEVAAAGELVVATRSTDRWSGWPRRERPRVVFRLAAGEWGRCVRNSRLGGARDWQYTRVVVNVAHLAGGLGTAAPDLFTTTEPTYVVNEEAHLR